MVVYQENVDGALEKLHTPSFESELHQIVISTLTEPVLVEWLKQKELPEPFFEDIASKDQTPVYEDFVDGNMMLLKHVKLDPEEFLDFFEENVALITLDNKLAVVCRDETTEFELSMKFERRMRGKKSNLYLEIYTFMDILADQSIQTMDRASVILENTEEKIVNGIQDRKNDYLKNLYYARRSLSRLSHIYTHENSAITKFITNTANSVKKKFRFEFNDIKDHKMHLITECKALQDRVAGLVNLQLGLSNTMMNESMQKLASISIIFLPLTFLASNYGMNFKNFPELDYVNGYHILQASYVVIAGSLYYWLRKKRWL